MDKGNGNRQNGTGQQRNWKGTGQNESRRFTRVHLTLHPFIQQEEIRKATRTKRM